VVWAHGPGTFFLRGYGRFGVHLFLALSGFLITTLLLRERARTGGISISKFYARRALRIFPLYYAVLLGYLIAVLAFGRNHPRGEEFLSNAPYFATYTINWHHTGPLNILFGHAWSLAVQEQFYFAWPLLLAFLPPRGALIGLALALSSSVWFSGVRMSPAIFFGASLAFLLNSPRGFILLWPVFGRYGAAPIAAVLLAGAVTMRLPAPVQGLLAAALIAACVIREDNGLAPALQWPPLVQAGLIGYGVYLLHLPIYSAVSRLGTALAFPLKPYQAPGFILTLALTIGAAFITHRYFEAPFLKLRTRFSTR
jgi:peptidoglycan/LPS O-acetylase OafA/YrhL